MASEGFGFLGGVTDNINRTAVPSQRRRKASAGFVRRETDEDNSQSEEYTQRNYQNATMVIPKKQQQMDMSFQQQQQQPVPQQQSATSLSLPPEIQEKLERWRNKRQEQLQSRAMQQQQQPPQQPPMVSQPRRPIVPAAALALLQARQNRLNGGQNALSGGQNTLNGDEQPPTEINSEQYQQDEQHQQDKQQQQDVTEYVNSADEIPLPMSNIAAVPNVNMPTFVPMSNVVSVPATNVAPVVSQGPSVESIFHPTNQEILKGLIAGEVRNTLDRLKKERAELNGQEDVLTSMTQKLTTVEHNLQEFNMREQRLRDTVDQLEVSFRAIQANIDEIKHDSNSSFVTEDVMRSWVARFYAERTEDMKAKVADEIRKGIQASQRREEEIQKLITSAVAQSIDGITRSVNDLERKFEHTAQKIYTTTCFTMATAVNAVKVYSSNDEKSKPLWEVKENERVMLFYPLDVREDKTIWIKTRRVNPDDAELSEGWIPLMLNGVINLGDFSLNR